MAAKKKAKKRPVPRGQATALPRTRPARSTTNPKRPAKVAKRPAKVAKRPAKVVKAAKRVATVAKRPATTRRPAKVAKTSKKVAKTSKKVAKTSKKVAKTSKKVAKTSKKVAKAVKKTAKVAKTSTVAKRVAKVAKKTAKVVKRVAKVAKKTAKAAKRTAKVAKRTAKVAKRTAKVAQVAKRAAKVAKRPVKKVAKHRPAPRFVPVTPAFVPYSPRREREKRGKWNAETQRVRDNLRQILEFAASIVRMNGWSARVETAAYDENIVDGDLYVEIPFNRASYEEISSMTRQVNDALNNVGKMPQGYISCGWKLHPDVQDDRLDQRYKKFEGALRVGLYYQKIRLIDENFLTAVTVLENMMGTHSRPPMGFIVRIEWSEDGVLHRRR